MDYDQLDDGKGRQKLEYYEKYRKDWLNIAQKKSLEGYNSSTNNSF